MRRSLLIAFVATVTLGAGCTFLADFRDVDPADAGADASASADGGSDAAEATAPDGGSPAFPPPCDPSFPLAEVACNPTDPRPGCASNTAVFPSYPPGQDRTNDLVTCNGGPTPTCVQHCPFGCATMPPGFPDACDDCANRPDGTYCVKDLQGADGRNLGLAVDCKGGKTILGHVCGVGRCATKCPRTDPLPSCCI